MVRFAAFPLVALLAASASASAQYVDAPGADTLSMWLIRGTDTVAVGRLLDRREQRAEGGRPVHVRTMTTDALVFGPRVDTIVADLATGMPIRHVGRAPRANERVEVQDGRATGQVANPDGTTRAVDVMLPVGTVHAANLDLVLRARLLRFGEVIPLSVFVPSLGSVGTVGVRVEGEEVVGTERAWRLRAVNLANDATYWVSQRDRSLLRHVMTGPNGLRLLFDRRTLPAPPGAPRPPGARVS